MCSPFFSKTRTGEGRGGEVGSVRGRSERGPDLGSLRVRREGYPTLTFTWCKTFLSVRHVVSLRCREVPHPHPARPSSSTFLTISGTNPQGQALWKRRNWVGVLGAPESMFRVHRRRTGHLVRLVPGTGRTRVPVSRTLDTFRVKSTRIGPVSKTYTVTGQVLRRALVCTPSPPRRSSV